MNKNRLILTIEVIATVIVLLIIMKVKNKSFDFLLELLLDVFILAIATIVTLIVHELGHLVFGLLTGYGFGSFRIFNQLFMKQHDKIIRKTFSVPGTLGQCLLTPPPCNNGKIPYILYNLGGILFNIIVATIFLVIGLNFHFENRLLHLFCAFMTLVGYLFVPVNGIPFGRSFPNDGYNTLVIGKNKDSLKGYYTGLKINELYLQGKTIKDIDDELLTLSEHPDLKNVMTSSILIFQEQKFMALKQFSKAYTIIEKCLQGECVCVWLHEAMLKLDKLYIDILKNPDTVDLSILEESTVKKLINPIPDKPSIIRTLYAVAVYKNDSAQQATLKQKMLQLKTKTTTLFPQDVEFELELMELCTKDR